MTEAARVLVERGADPEAADDEGEIPAGIADSVGLPDAAEAIRVFASDDAAAGASPGAG